MNTSQPSDPVSPLIAGVNTINKLELSIVPIDLQLAVTSAAVSLKRIADTLQMISGSLSNANHYNQKEREALEGVRNGVVNNGTHVIGVIGAIDRLAANVKELGPK